MMGSTQKVLGSIGELASIISCASAMLMRLPSNFGAKSKVRVKSLMDEHRHPWCAPAKE